MNCDVNYLATLGNLEKAVDSYRRMREAAVRRKTMNVRAAGELRGLADDVTASGADVHHISAEMGRLATELEAE